VPVRAKPPSAGVVLTAVTASIAPNPPVICPCPFLAIGFCGLDVLGVGRNVQLKIFTNANLEIVVFADPKVAPEVEVLHRSSGPPEIVVVGAAGGTVCARGMASASSSPRQSPLDRRPPAQLRPGIFVI